MNVGSDIEFYNLDALHRHTATLYRGLDTH